MNVAGSDVFVMALKNVFLLKFDEVLNFGAHKLRNVQLGILQSNHDFNASKVPLYQLRAVAHQW